MASTAVLARRGLCSSSAQCARLTISPGVVQNSFGQNSASFAGWNCHRCRLGSSFVSWSWRQALAFRCGQRGDISGLSGSIAFLRRFDIVQDGCQTAVVTASAASPVGTIVSESASALEDSTAGNAVEPLTWRASIDLKGLRENKDAIAANIINRKSSGDVELVVQLYEQTVRLSMEVEKLRAARNAVANAIKGKLEREKRQELINQGKELKDRLAGLEVELGQLSDKLQREGQRIPNITHPDVPIGSEDVASVRKTVGQKLDFSFRVKTHVELCQDLDLLDFEAAAEAGSGSATGADRGALQIAGPFENGDMQSSLASDDDDFPYGDDRIAQELAAMTGTISISEHVPIAVRSVCVGIDPDLSGAIAVLRTEDNTTSAKVIDVPCVTVAVNKKMRRRHNYEAIANLVRQLQAPAGSIAYVEQAMPFPKDGKQGWYITGYGYGIWLGILASAGFTIFPVQAKVWKTAMGICGKDFTKDDSRALASSLFPDLSPQLNRKKDHGRAEALLIAAFGKGMAVTHLPPE